VAFIDKQHIKLYIREGKDLGAFDVNGKSDPYCVVRILDGIERKTTVHKKTLNPKFFQKMIEINDTPKQKIAERPVAIVIEMFDKDLVGKDDFMGRVTIDGATVANGASYLSLPLKPREGKEKQDKKVKGELIVDVNLIEEVKLSEQELKEIIELTHFGDNEIKTLFDTYKQQTHGGELKSVTDLEELLTKSSSRGKSWIEALIKQTDVSGKNTLYDLKDEEFKQMVKNDKEMRTYVIQTIWNALDTDGNGSVNFKELIIGLSLICSTDPVEKARFQFRVMDTDKSGYLDRSEVTKLAQFRSHAMRAKFEMDFEKMRLPLYQCNISYANQEKIKNEVVKKLYFSKEVVNVSVDLCMKHADKDQDGKITEDEYVSWASDPQQMSEYATNFEIVLHPILENLKAQAQSTVQEVMMRILRGY